MRASEFELNRVYEGDCLDLAKQLPASSIDVIVTSPPYWGQRLSGGVGIEEDPREYVKALASRFAALKPALKPDGLLWINLGDSYNTPVNWTRDCFVYSTLGPDKKGFHKDNAAYAKPRHKRKAFIKKDCPWLQYGNLLALPHRLVISLCDSGFLFRGEVIWKKVNPMPEGKCRRPHRGHEGIYLFAKEERHAFQVAPPIKSVWEFANDGLKSIRHFSRFPMQLPLRCIQAYGKTGKDVIVLDPFSGSATTGLAGQSLGCSYLGFEIDRRSSLRLMRPLHSRRKSEPLLRLGRESAPVRDGGGDEGRGGGGGPGGGISAGARQRRGGQRATGAGRSAGTARVGTGTAPGRAARPRQQRAGRRGDSAAAVPGAVAADPLAQPG